jgi:hypothetical protein
MVDRLPGRWNTRAALRTEGTVKKHWINFLRQGKRGDKQSIFHFDDCLQLCGLQDCLNKSMIDRIKCTGRCCMLTFSIFKRNCSMENTFQPCLPSFRSKVAAIEAMELCAIGFSMWGLHLLIPGNTADTPLFVLILILFLIEGFLLGSRPIYIAYIRLSRAVGRYIRYGLWMAAIFLSASILLWSGVVLDVNRFLLAKWLYRGEAPVEFAISWRSRERRRLWEQMQRASQPEQYL